VGHRRAGAVVRRAGAGIEVPATGQPARLGHHRTGAELLLLLPRAAAHLVAVGAVDWLIAVCRANPLPRLDDRSVARLGHLGHVLLVHWMARGPAYRHLVLLHHWLAHGVAVLTHVLLIQRAVRGPAHRHLVLLPHLPVNRVGAGTHVLFVHGSVRGPA